MGDTRSSIDTPWLCYPEAAEYLRVALGTLRNMVSVGSVPFVRRKGIVRFHRDDLDSWLRERANVIEAVAKELLRRGRLSYRKAEEVAWSATREPGQGHG